MLIDIRQHCDRYLVESGEEAGDVWSAARRVVWARYAGLSALSEALGALEAVVGRPASEEDI